ncbi:hypothetical protein GX50_03983 [[Emmonsia] crescens]|uniref:Uncharacterized protein n=1 Tax=[Emmonsia] crescens TaxID=73230 RepID=A0A2B7ZIN4_9EURO|nr:hypothetical protein GX50_03983 [Emmonsia crescens]
MFRTGVLIVQHPLSPDNIHLTATQAEELQTELAEALKVQEIIDSLSEEEGNMQKLSSVRGSRRTKKQLDQ